MSVAVDHTVNNIPWVEMSSEDIITTIDDWLMTDVDIPHPMEGIEMMKLSIDNYLNSTLNILIDEDEWYYYIVDETIKIILQFITKFFSLTYHNGDIEMIGLVIKQYDHIRDFINKGNFDCSKEPFKWNNIGKVNAKNFFKSFPLFTDYEKYRFTCYDKFVDIIDSINQNIHHSIEHINKCKYIKITSDMRFRNKIRSAIIIQIKVSLSILLNILNNVNTFIKIKNKVTCDTSLGFDICSDSPLFSDGKLIIFQ